MSDRFGWAANGSRYKTGGSKFVTESRVACIMFVYEIILK